MNWMEFITGLLSNCESVKAICGETLWYCMYLLDAGEESVGKSREVRHAKYRLKTRSRDAVSISLSLLVCYLIIATYHHEISFDSSSSTRRVCPPFSRGSVWQTVSSL